MAFAEITVRTLDEGYCIVSKRIILCVDFSEELLISVPNKLPLNTNKSLRVRILNCTKERVATRTIGANTGRADAILSVGTSMKRLLFASPAVQLRAARTGDTLVGLDRPETADAFLRLLAGHWRTAANHADGNNTSTARCGSVGSTGLPLCLVGSLGLLPHGFKNA